MKILFLTLLDFDNLEEQGIYTDLMRTFQQKGHEVFIISPREKRKQLPTQLIVKEGYTILKLEIGNMQKTNVVEKGISTLTLENRFVKGIQNYFADIRFDWVLYSTPPITLQKAVEFVKKRDQAKTYLLLKDIFPQNALDLGMLRESGLKGFIYRYFKKKEKKLYEISDYIGCMSPANVKFLLKENSQLDPSRVEVCPNSIEPMAFQMTQAERDEIREKYGIPKDKTVFIYGGNLGKPQGIPYLIECLDYSKDIEGAYFLIVGSGTEYSKLDQYFRAEKRDHAQLFAALPKTDYEKLANACDVGLIFLDNRFTIPNFPSRMLSYMQASMPILAATDLHTDVGDVITQGQFGLWCQSQSPVDFGIQVKLLCEEKLRKQYGYNARQYLEKHYRADQSYEIIMKHINDERGAAHV